MKYLWTTLMAGAAALVFGGATLAAPVTAKNWTSHPDIVAVRAIYQADQALKNSGQLKKRQREFEACDVGVDESRALYTDVSGTPRIYEYEKASEDSHLNYAVYYDETGALRFGLVTAKAINGTKIEHRIYFSPNGEKLWEIQKQLKGPGYSFPKQWEESSFPHAPEEAFLEKSVCRENKK